MKKLMIAAAIVCAAAFANAASMTWATASTVYDPTGTEVGGDGTITMYLWSINQAAYDALNTGDISANVWNTYGSKLGTATKYVVEEEGAMALKDPATYTSGNTAYAAVLFAYDPDDTGITHYKGNIGEWEFTSTADKTQINMDTVIGGGTSGTALAWTAVPEPTSGLLLLLGMAGLALRRKQQKA